MGLLTDLPLHGMHTFSIQQVLCSQAISSFCALPAPLPQVRRSGTTADKVAAMSLMVGSSAAGGLKSMDGLLGMMGKSGGGKQLVLAAMEALQVCLCRPWVGCCGVF
jgi:hypothetical protein